MELGASGAGICLPPLSGSLDASPVLLHAVERSLFIRLALERVLCGESWVALLAVIPEGV
jgi:hypothetical protein